MDDLLGQPLPPPTMPRGPTAPPGVPEGTRAPGRPAGDPAARASADRRYADRLALEGMLPAEASELRIVAFAARPGQDAKGGHTPLLRILKSTWEDQGLKDSATLRSYLQDKLGPGRYYMEPQDAHNRRMDSIPCWVISTTEDDDMPDDLDDDDLPLSRAGRGRPSRRRRAPAFIDDLDDDDGLQDDEPQAHRANIADFLTVQARAQTESAERDKKAQSDMMTTIMMLQQQQAEAQRKADERREEMQREERRLERERDERRREEERKIHEEKMDERRREDDRRRDEQRLAMEQSNKKTELMVAAATAMVPVIAKLLEPKPVDPLLMSLVTKPQDKQADPLTMMLMKSMLDRQQGSESMTQMIQGMAEMNRMSTSMMAEQMKSVMATTNDLNQQVLKRAMEMQAGGEDEGEDKGMLGNIVSALSSASGLIDSLGLKQQAPQQQAQHTIPHHQAPLPQGAPPQQQHPQQQQQQQPVTPTGIEAVGGAMMALHAGAYQSEEQRNQLIAFLLHHTPDDLRMAIATGNEPDVMSICAPVFMANEELVQWLTTEGTVEWIREFLSTLQPALAQQMGLIQGPQGSNTAQAPGAADDAPEVSDDDDDDDDDGPV